MKRIGGIIWQDVLCLDQSQQSMIHKGDYQMIVVNQNTNNNQLI